MDENNAILFNIDNTVDEQECLESTDNENVSNVSMELPNNEKVEEPEEAFESITAPIRPKVTPEQQCEALFQNYLTTHPNSFLSGPQKRSLKRSILRDCKRGKYEHIFNS